MCITVKIPTKVFIEIDHLSVTFETFTSATLRFIWSKVSYQDMFWINKPN